MASSRSRRFEIVVFNFRRLRCFTAHIGKLLNFDRRCDRLTIVSSSPSAAERNLVHELSAALSAEVRYLSRRNYGMAELARAEFFAGKLSRDNEHFQYPYLFQFQDHYLDTEASCSRWEATGLVKGDVIPDGMVIDLDELHAKLTSGNLDGAFCDRNHPSWFQLGERPFVAPSGGNFVIATRLLQPDPVQQQLRRLMDSCDGKYSWALFAEFFWGELLFGEGGRFLDLRRRQVYSSWPREQFYVPPDDYRALRARYWEKRPAFRRSLLRWLANAG